MKATELEFRYRFWIIGAIFWIGFSGYRWAPRSDANGTLPRTQGKQ
jgi:hypothetical protein